MIAFINPKTPLENISSILSLLFLNSCMHDKTNFKLLITISSIGIFPSLYSFIAFKVFSLDQLFNDPVFNPVIFTLYSDTFSLSGISMCQT